MAASCQGATEWNDTGLLPELYQQYWGRGQWYRAHTDQFQYHVHHTSTDAIH